MVEPLASPPAPAAARDAATIMLVRDGVHEGSTTLEVCMLRRHVDSFIGGAYVFPGGKVDADDRTAMAEDVCVGRSDAQASALLDMESGGLAFWVAALRECFEEAGVLLAYEDGATDTLIDMAEPEARHALAATRVSVNAGDLDFLEACRRQGLKLAVDRVHYFSHWVTPELAPKRFDTRFFVADLPPGQVPIHDEYETVDTVWVRPGDALARAKAGEFDLIFPTMKNLEAIGRFSTCAQLVEAAATIERVPTVMPRVIADATGVRICLPGDPGYDDVVAAAAVPERGTPATEMSNAEVNDVVRRIGIDGRIRRDDP